MVGLLLALEADCEGSSRNKSYALRHYPKGETNLHIFRL